MTVGKVRVCILFLTLNIAIELHGFGKADPQSSVNAPDEDPPRGLEITSCGDNNLGKVLGVYLTECDNPPCILKRKKKYNYFLEFSPNEDHASLDANFEASLLGLKTPVEALNGDICDKLLGNKKCPFKQGETYVLQLPVDIDEVMPPLIATLLSVLSTANLQLKVSLELKDPVKENKFCIALAAIVK